MYHSQGMKGLDQPWKGRSRNRTLDPGLGSQRLYHWATFPPYEETGRSRHPPKQRWRTIHQRKGNPSQFNEPHAQLNWTLWNKGTPYDLASAPSAFIREFMVDYWNDRFLENFENQTIINDFLRSRHVFIVFCQDEQRMVVFRPT